MNTDRSANIYRINMFSQNSLARSDEALQEYFKSSYIIKIKGFFTKRLFDTAAVI